MRFESVYRRSEVAFPALLALLLVFAGGIWLAVGVEDQDRMILLLSLSFGLAIFGMFFILANAFRVQSWEIVPGGVRVSERPKVPLTGIGRNAHVAFADIAALLRVDSNAVQALDMVLRDGRSFRLAQQTAKLESIYGGALTPAERPAMLDEFLVAVHQAAQGEGVALPQTGEGLSFWNTVPGLAFLLLMLLLTLALAVGVLWALIEGSDTGHARRGYFIGIVLVLPVGVGWLIRRSLRRRREVMESLGVR